jgi:hypothetical protein
LAATAAKRLTIAQQFSQRPVGIVKIVPKTGDQRRQRDESKDGGVDEAAVPQRGGKSVSL